MTPVPSTPQQPELHSELAQPTEHLLTVAPGVRLAVRCWTPATSTPGSNPGLGFVLVHGLASNARLWDGVARVLVAAGHWVAAIDLRGHGHSDQVPEGHTTDQAAADVSAVIAELGWDSPIVAGQSWGGNVVLHLAAKYPSSVRAVAFVDGGWLHLGGGFATFEDAWKTLAPPEFAGRIAFDDLGSRIAAMHPTWPAESLAGTLANLERLPDGTARAFLPRRAHKAILESMYLDNPAALYGSVLMPTLLMPALPEPGTQQKGPGGQLAAIATALASIPQSLLSAYVGADHDLHGQHPARVAADLLSLAAWAAGDLPPARWETAVPGWTDSTGIAHSTTTSHAGGTP